MELRLLSFNVCLSVGPPVRYNGAPQRAARLADSIYSSISPKLVDVICVQELVVAHSKILRRMTHHPYHTSPIRTSLFGNNIRLIQSGLVTFSRSPIVEEDAHVFTGATYHAEAFMAKAVQYAKIIMNHGRDVIHVFNTHLQAWTTPRACAIRKEQSRQAAEFVRRKVSPEALARGEKVALLGDFNICFQEHADMIREMMHDMQMEILWPKTVQFSFDPCTNPLTGFDDANEYRTRSKQNGCYEEFIKTGLCTCCPRQLVDGVVLHKATHAQLLSSETNVVPIKSRAPFEVHIDMGTRRTIETVSDHFAVLAHTVFPQTDSTLRYDDTVRHNAFKSPVHLGWIVFELLVFCILFLLFWMFLNWIANKIDRRIQLWHSTTMLATAKSKLLPPLVS